MPLSGDFHAPFDKSQAKWSLPRTIQFVTLACGLCWLLFLISIRSL